MFDAPTPSDVAEQALGFLRLSDRNVEKVLATLVFDTYVVIDGKPVYRITWRASGSAGIAPGSTSSSNISVLYHGSNVARTGLTGYYGQDSLKQHIGALENRATEGVDSHRETPGLPLDPFASLPRRGRRSSATPPTVPSWSCRSGSFRLEY
jgi:hypothetical protein